MIMVQMHRAVEESSREQLTVNSQRKYIGTWLVIQTTQAVAAQAALLCYVLLTHRLAGSASKRVIQDW